MNAIITASTRYIIMQSAAYLLIGINEWYLDYAVAVGVDLDLGAIFVAQAVLAEEHSELRVIAIFEAIYEPDLLL